MCDRDKLVKIFKIQRHEESGVVSFAIDCPFGICTHSDESTVHYGNEEDAETATIGKMIVHCQKEHEEAIKNLSSMP